VSRLNNLYAASQRLEDLNIRTLGVVINGVQGQTYGGNRYPYPNPAKAQAKV
jgi:hypothetical protein